MEGLLETKKDYSSELEVLIPTSIQVVAEKGLDEALNLLFTFEKKCRLNNDFSSLKEVCLHMLRICKEKEDWNRIVSTLTLISKKRAQSKMAIHAIVTEALTYLDSTPSKEIKVQIITTLKEICEGKIYVEAESARLHMMLARIHEEAGEVEKACDMIQDVHVETYGSLSKKEKAEYIIEQVRLNLKRGDLIRTLIQARKMNRKTIEEKGFEEIKIRFYQLLISYHSLRPSPDCWQLSQAYLRIFETPSLRPQDPEPGSPDPLPLLQDALQGCVLFLLLAPHSPHRTDLIHRLKTRKEVGTLCPPCLDLLRLFSCPEIVPLSFSHRDLLLSLPAMQPLRLGGRGQAGWETWASFLRSPVPVSPLSATLSYETGEAIKTHLDSLLTKRTIQHSLRVVATYYSRIRLGRLSVLLGLGTETLEEHLAEMAVGEEEEIVETDTHNPSTPSSTKRLSLSSSSPMSAALGSGGMYVKINRPAAIVSFARPRPPEEVLSDWGSDVSKLVGLLEKTSHLIKRENMVHGLND